MTRSHRLLALLDLLRYRRTPVTAQALAEQLDVSVRSIYRDIATLQEQGAPIDGAAGLGYQMASGFWLPALNFTNQELEALVLGMRWVSKQADPLLAESARSSLSKILSALPDELAEEVSQNTLLVGPQPILADNQVVMDLKRCLRDEFKAAFDYRSLSGERSRRTVWPFAMGYFQDALIVMAWCELREDFRHFRVDRISHVAIDQSQRYPTPKSVLMSRWHELQKVPHPLPH